MSSRGPFFELLEALRADGFPVGVDDHVRVARLLSRDHAWSEDELKEALRCALAKDLEARARFDEVWARTMAAPDAASGEGGAPTAVELLVDAAGGASSANPGDVGAHPRRWSLAALGALALTAAIGVAVWSRSPDRDRGLNEPVAASSDAGANAPTTGGGVPLPAPIEQPQPDIPLTAPGRPLPAIALSSEELDALQPPAPPPLPTLRERLWPWTLPLAAVGALSFLGALLLVRRARRRRSAFLPGPWQYQLRIPETHSVPAFGADEVEDAAADLTWRSQEPGDGVWIERTVEETVAAAGYPVIVPAPPPPSPEYALAVQDGVEARPWRWIFDELGSALRRAGVALQSFSFSGEPSTLATADGARTVELRGLAESIDGLIVVGDAERGVDAMTGEPAEWVGEIASVPQRLWLNPLPATRWPQGANAVERTAPMEHATTAGFARIRPGAVAGAKSADSAGWPPILELHPASARGLKALRAYLGAAFACLEAVALSGDPDPTIARWLAQKLPVKLTQAERLRLFTLPWLVRRRWPDGLRERLVEGARARDPELERSVHAAVLQLLEANRPAPGSLAHAKWELEHATAQTQLGNDEGRERLVALVESPVHEHARAALGRLGLRDRSGWSAAAAVAVGMVCLVGTAAIVVPFPAQQGAPAPVAAASTEERHRGAIRCAAFAGNDALVTAGEDGTVRVWNGQTGKHLRTVTLPVGGITRLAVAPDGTRAVVVGDGGGAALVDVTAGKELAEWQQTAEAARVVAFSPDGAQVAVGTEAGNVDVYDARDGRLRSRLIGHRTAVTFVAFTGSGTGVFKAFEDGTLGAWDLETGEKLSEHGDLPGATQFVLNDRGFYWLADGLVRSGIFSPPASPPTYRRNVISVAEITVDGEEPLPYRDVRAIAWSAQTGLVVAEGSRDISVETGRRTIPAEADEGLAVSTDGARVAAVHAGNVTVWDATSGRALAKVESLPVPPRRGQALLFASSTAVDDAKAVARELRHSYGFGYEIVGADSGDQVRAKLKAYADRTFGPQDQLIVAFFGGGGQTPESSVAGVPISELQPMIDAIPCPHTLVLADAAGGIQKSNLPPRYPQGPQEPHR